MHLLPVTVIMGMAMLGAGKEVAADPAPDASTPFSKYVVSSSLPHTLDQGRTGYEEAVGETATTCPMGRAGLSCRRAEARRGVENCPNGACNACDMCAGANSTVVWPNCCKHSGVCCSQLAQSCQKCDQPDLLDFCRKHFKRCFATRPVKN